jgi:hypothetical protein
LGNKIFGVLLKVFGATGDEDGAPFNDDSVSLDKYSQGTQLAVTGAMPLKW